MTKKRFSTLSAPVLADPQRRQRVEEYTHAARASMLVEPSAQQGSGAPTLASTNEATEATAGDIDDIEGIGPAWAGRLKAHGITTTDALLKEGATPQGRKTIATATAIDEGKILEWVNHADLARINGVGWEYADLLEAAGVDTVPELAQRNSDNLYAKLTEVNEAKNLVRRLPTVAQVATWVTAAKTLPKMIRH